MKTFLGATACAFSVLLVAGCAAPLNRDTEVALNKAVGIEVASVADGVAVKLPETALFDFNKSDVRADAGAVVDRSAVLLKRSKKPIVVEGYTDNVGTLEYNQQLSEARATSVGYALVGTRRRAGPHSHEGQRVQQSGGEQRYARRPRVEPAHGDHRAR